MIGKTVSHYKIIEQLGAGGMGVVYKAHDTKLKRTVALKFLPPQLSSDPETKERFIHEAQAASALDHPNICTIHEIGETDDGQSYIAMSCYDGHSLKDIIKPAVGANRVEDPVIRGSVAQPVNVDQSIQVIIQIARGLQKAHEKSIVHRDIKPANIMITDDGTAKILDFGLAKLAGQTRLTKTGSTVGTAAYMSPEQAKGDPVDQRTDIWSLGVVMYEMFSGKIPFEADYEQAMVYSIINEQPLPITVLNENVSAELEQIVNKCLAKDLNDRYQTIDDLLVDFRGFSKEFDISFDESLPILIKRLWRRKLVRRFLSLTATILLVGVMYLLFWPNITEPIPIAVISFENQTGDKDYDMWSKSIPNLLITNLEQSGRFQVVTMERLRDLLKQIGKDSVEFIDSELGFQLCGMDGISNIVVGTFAKIGDMFATDLKVLDVETKDILQSAQSKGTGENSILETQIDELTKQITIEFGDITEEKYAESHLSLMHVTTKSPEAYNYYILGREHFDAYRHEEARNNLAKAVRLDSTFAMAHIYLAYAYYMSGKHPKEFDTYLTMAKKYRHKLTHKEQILLDYDYAAMKGLDLSNSIRVLEEAISFYPKEKQIVIRLARSYADIGEELDTRIVYLKKVLDLDPKDKRTLNNIGYAYVKKRNYTKALEYLQRFADAGPNDFNAYDSMGEVYLMMNNYKKSIEMYQKAFNLDPHGYPYALIGLNYIKMGEFQKARTHLNQWYKSGSSYDDQMFIQRFMAISYFAEGDFGNALIEMEKKVMLAKQESDTFQIAENQFYISEILYMNGKIKESEERLTLGKKLIESSNLVDNYKYRLWRTFYWHSTRLAVKKGNIDQAKKYAEKYKDYDINKYLTLSGLIAYTENNYEKAIAQLNQSNLDDTFTNYYQALVNIKTGDIDKAIDRLKRVVDYNDPLWIQNELFRYHANKQLAILNKGN